MVKTRAFAVREERESTLLIPAADFLNHHPEPNARQNLLDPTHFVATRNISAFEEVGALRTALQGNEQQGGQRTLSKEEQGNG